MGKRFVDVIAAIEASVGNSLPSGFAASYQARTFARFRRELCTVPGARVTIIWAAFVKLLEFSNRLIPLVG
jgi:hypothetical protein